ncbi:MAG: LacI family DNA-binding transcriptional regulator [Oscillibacter sp.]
MGRVTIKDIAKLAGVSVTTVSRALNQAPEISEETRERVLALCREQGYRTNFLARSLSSSRSKVLGVILPDISNPFHAELSLNIETMAQEQGYQVMLCNGRPGDAAIEDLFDFLISQRVDGVLFSSAITGAPELVCRYQAVLPTVLMGACPPEDSGIRVNTVSTDNTTGGRMAAQYLYRLGHRDVVYLGLRSGSATQALRHRGFVLAAEDLGMTVRTMENPGRASTIDSGYLLAGELFRQPFPQTAVFAATDSVALGVMKAADEWGLSIPGRLSVLGFDNIDFAALPNIRLTTLDQRKPLLARMALDLLLTLINSEERAGYTTQLITPLLVERSSCRDVGQHPAIHS